MGRDRTRVPLDTVSCALPGARNRLGRTRPIGGIDTRSHPSGGTGNTAIRLGYTFDATGLEGVEMAVSYRPGIIVVVPNGLSLESARP